MSRPTARGQMRVCHELNDTHSHTVEEKDINREYYRLVESQKTTKLENQFSFWRPDMKLVRISVWFVNTKVWYITCRLFVLNQLQLSLNIESLLLYMILSMFYTWSCAYLCVCFSTVCQVIPLCPVMCSSLNPPPSCWTVGWTQQQPCTFCHCLWCTGISILTLITICQYYYHYNLDHSEYI